MKGDDDMKALKWVNTFAFAAMIAVNALAELLPIGGNTTGQISETYPNLFTPAPVTFAIWGLIYLLMTVFVVYQWGVFDGGAHSTKVREDVGILFALSCALNIAWILLWHNGSVGLAAICIVLLLATLYVIQGSLTRVGGNLLQRMAAKAGFSLYYGWIIAATFTNFCVYLTRIGWNGQGVFADLLTIIALLFGAVIAAVVAMIGGNRIAALAVAWAYAGILIRHISPAYFGGAHPYVIATAFFSEAVILAAILAPWIEQLQEKLRFASVK